MGTNCAPLVAYLFLFCYERDFMKDLFSDNQADFIKAFNSTSRYLDDLLNIDNPYFEGMVNQIIHPNCNLIKLILQIPKPPFWIYICLFLTALFHPKFMINVMTLILIVNFPFLDGDVPSRPSYGVLISQLIRFARVCSHVETFVINALLLNFLNRVIGIIRLERLFLSSIADTMN